MDLKFDAQFGWLASVGNGFAQVSQLQTTDGSEYFEPLASNILLMAACFRTITAYGSISYVLTIYCHQYSFPRRWRKYTCLHS
jgi:hypothetical protein